MFVEFERLEPKINWHKDEASARKEYRSYLED
jgi:hypothetical protein